MYNKLHNSFAMGGESPIIISIVLLAAGIYVFGKNRHDKMVRFAFLFVSLASFLLIIFHEVISFFTGKGIDEAALYHLRYGLEGAGFGEYYWLIMSASLAILLGIIGAVWFIMRNPVGKKANFENSTIAFTLLIVSVLLNPTILSLYDLQAKNETLTQKQQAEISTDFYHYYQEPYITPQGDSQKNIVFIYAESLEHTYFDEALFPGLMKNLKDIESRNVSFTGISQATGTGWTMGGVTASLCGIPLFTTSHGNSMAGMDEFLPAAKCLSDLLHEQKYELEYLGGADTAFAGKGKFLKTHGFSKVQGYQELISDTKDQDSVSGWGISDDEILGLSYERFEQLSEMGGKFGLFTLTLDTHQPTGHPSKSCHDIVYQDGKNKMLNAVACSDRLIADFIKKIIASPYASKIVVVLASDHLAMKNTASALLDKVDRKNMLMIIEPGQNEQKIIETPGSTLDIGPTIIPLIGYQGEIGLGRNLLSDDSNVGQERNTIRKNLTRWRDPIIQFWGFPRIERSLQIEPAEELVSIDGRSFGIPILIELGDDLQTTLKFQFYRVFGQKTLIDHLKNMDSKTRFVLIDECKSLSVFDQNVGLDGFCLMAGRGYQYSKVQELAHDLSYEYNPDEIRQIFEKIQ